MSEVPTPVTSEVSNDLPKVKDSPEIPKKPSVPRGLFISKFPDIEVVVYVYKASDTEALQAVFANPLTEDQRQAATISKIPLKTKFSIPTRKQLNRYRDKSAAWVPEAQSLIPNRSMVRSLLIRNHLLEWDLVDPDTGENVKIKRDGEGKLAPDSEEILDDLHPMLFEVLMGKYEREADILY